jgi:hypothetical protein
MIMEEVPSHRPVQHVYCTFIKSNLKNTKLRASSFEKIVVHFKIGETVNCIFVSLLTNIQGDVIYLFNI